MMEFGTRLRDLRIGHNMTQDEAAMAINVTKQAISKWENDRGLPDVASLGALAELYNVSIDYLLTGSEIEKEVEVVEKEKIVEVEKPLSKETLKALWYQYRRFRASKNAGIIVVPLCIIVGCLFIIPSVKNFSSSLIIWLIFGIVYIILGIAYLFVSIFYTQKKLEKIKKEIKEITGKDADYWKYRDIK